jgi:hypothetical protein
MVLPVIARRVYGDTALLVVRHPDGSRAHIPEWMTSTEVAVFSPRDRVVISVRNLRDLRSALDVLLSSFSSDSVDGGGHGKTTCVQSTESVSSESAEVRRVAIERAKLLPLLRSLLLEVVFGANPERPSKESDHE